MRMSGAIRLAVLAALACLPAMTGAFVFAADPSASVAAVRVSDAVTPVISPPLSSLVPFLREPRGAENEEEVENRVLPHPSASTVSSLGPLAPDSVVQRSFGRSAPTPAGVSFDGVAANGYAPPDTNGRVGPNHYIQWVNTQLAIYSKTGTLLLGPVAGNTLFTSLGGPCATTNEGDPIGQYDALADRWVLTQFVVDAAVPAVSHQCYAISVTGNPLGSYYLYDFTTAATEFVDYPHVGVWPDGYYMTSHIFNFPGTFYLGQGLHVFERQQMLIGAPARLMFVNLGQTYGGALPSDLDSLAPPPAGSPNYVVAPGSPALDGSASPRLHVWKAAVTWGPAPTFVVTGPTEIATASFNGDMCGFARSCIPEPAPAGAGDYLDAISDRSLYRVAYRNNGTSESLVLNHTVNVATSPANQAGVRWYELRGLSTTPTIFQQGTFAPDAKNRWMGSIAQDNSGNMALGYSLSDTSTFPSIALSGRLSTDAAGTMGAEITMMAGAGSQLSTGNRWGDYSAMTVDPRDGCTFWYTNQYLASTGSFNWKTRVATFSFPSCTAPAKATISGTVTDCVSGNPVANVLVQISDGHSAATDASGNYSIVVPPGSYTVQAIRTSCGASTTSAVTVAAGGTATRNFCVPPGPGFSFGTIAIDDSLGNGNGRINRDECIRLSLPLHNIGCATASTVTATLTSGTPGVTVTDSTSAYPDIAAGATQTNAVPFQISTSSSFVCGTPIGLILSVTASGVTSNVPFALASCQPPALVLSGSITGTDPTQTGRLIRTNPLGTCEGKACPGLQDSTARHYSIQAFTNSSTTDRCVTIVTTTGCGTSFIFPVAYLGTFNPASLCVNYLGDPAASPNPSNEFYVDVPAGQTISLVVHEVNAGAGCSSYSATVYGLLDASDGGGGNDLALTNVDSDDPVLVGTNVTYTVTVHNGGTSSANNVTVIDTLPAGTAVSVTPSAGSCSGTAIRSCNFGTLAAGATATLTIVMTAPGTPGTMTNVASVSATGCDPNGSNDAAIQSTAIVGSISPFALVVDSAPASGTASNANGVLEPGETVLVKPSWRNNTASPSAAFTGAASGFTGPAGAAYGIPDAAAAYGTIPGAAAGDCGSNCYELSVSNPASRPAAHWDATFDENLSVSASKTWVLHVGASFTDVPVGTGFYKFVETIFHKGITAGCGGANYCPGTSVTRAQMSVFLLVAEHGAGFTPAPAVGIFSDVPASDPFAKWIERLYAEGITGGCATTPLQYCPGSPVTRAQMAVFLIIAEHGSGYVPPSPTGIFLDMPVSSPFAKYVEQLFAEGVTAGCGGGNYCPSSPSTRGQMAVFLTTTFGLKLYGP